MNQSERRHYLIQYLLKEHPEYQDMNIPAGKQEQKLLLRGLMNVRMPQNANVEFLTVQDAYLKEETERKTITRLLDLKPVQEGIYLWQGDITALECDAIVNAANSGMTGCYVPNHRCIDNCIHTFAGVQLRLECARIMLEQGYEEPTGQAKITKAYNLPCNYILHTVGPIIQGKLTKRDEELLASCYRSCLQVAVDNGIRSIAFPSISTGIYHFPLYEAVKIAVRTAKEFAAEYPGELDVIKWVLFDDNTLKAYADEIEHWRVSEMVQSPNFYSMNKMLRDGGC